MTINSDHDGVAINVVVHSTGCIVTCIAMDVHIESIFIKLT